MPEMQFTYLTWEAFATLLTGIAAVIAAYFVGRRQANILASQHSLEELKLRSELFERRFEIYKLTREWLDHTLAHGTPPNTKSLLHSQNPESEQKLQADFLAAIDRSRFLFRPSVHEALREVWRLSFEVSYRDRAMNRSTNTQEQLASHADASDAAFKSLEARLKNLASVFGDELNLSVHGSVFGPRPTVEQGAP